MRGRIFWALCFLERQQSVAAASETLKKERRIFWRVRKLLRYFKTRIDGQKFCGTSSFAIAPVFSREFGLNGRIDQAAIRTLHKLYFTPTTTLVNPCVCVLILNALKCSICLVISLSEVTFSKGNELNL
jgi:hypothetical protein